MRRKRSKPRPLVCLPAWHRIVSLLRFKPTQFCFRREARMIRSILFLGALAAASNVVLAQQAQQPTARGPELALALEGAQAAVAACAMNGVKAAVSVVNSGGVLRLLLTADATTDDQIEISCKKAATAVTLKAATSEIADQMEKDAA